MGTINVATNLQHVRDRVAAAERQANRSPGSVHLLAVSKTKPAALIREAWAAGQEAFGENYAQEAQEKVRALTDLAIQWHFIGPVQSNKTRGLANTMAWIHSVDRLKIAQRLSEQRNAALPPLNICLQVKLSDEATKFGVSPDELPILAAQVDGLANLRLRGLMAIPAASSDRATQRAAFARLRRLFERLRENHPLMDTLSMGMSGDLEAAIAEGSHLVRVGTDVFGAR